TGSLELREWRDQMVIIKIVIKAEVLLVIEAMVKPQRKLIPTLWLYRCCHECIAAVRGHRNILQQVNRSGIQAAQRNNVVLPGRQNSEDAIVGSCGIRKGSVWNPIVK